MTHAAPASTISYWLMLHASKCIPYVGVLRNQSFSSPVSKTFQDHLLCLPMYSIFPSLWSLGGWCGYFPGLTSSTSSSSPALGLQANKNGQHLSTCSSNPRNMYVQQNAWRWTRSFNRVKAIFGFFRQTSAPWRVPRRSTHQKHTHRPQQQIEIVAFRSFNIWRPEIRPQKCTNRTQKNTKLLAQAHFKIHSRKLWRWRKAEVWPPSSQPSHEKAHWISTSDTEWTVWVHPNSQLLT